MTKQGVKGKCQRTLNEKYKMYYSPHTNEENNKYKLIYNQVHKL